MLIRELIVRHAGRQGALHERGIRLDQTEVPPGIRVHNDGDFVAPVAGDLLLVSAPVGTGLREHVDAHLTVGATVVLLLEVEVADLPVGRVLAALAAARLQVVEAAVVSGVPAATVAVVATRTDNLVVPTPYLAHDLEPGSNEGPSALRRVLGEHALEGLVQRARERALLAQVAEIGTRLAEVTTEAEQLRADRQNSEAMVAAHEVTVRDLDIARKEAATEHKRMLSLVRDLDSSHKDADSARKEADTARKDADTARKDADTARKEADTARRDVDTARKEADTARKEADAARRRIQSLRSSRSFRVASRLARVSGVARRIVRRPVQGTPPSAE